MRTRLLIRDAAEALASYWGPESWTSWLANNPARDRIETIRHEDLGPPGFHLAPEQIMSKTDPEIVPRLSCANWEVT